MTPLVLLTDFGLQDHYVGTIKGVILSIHPTAVVVDLSHEVRPQNIVQAAMLLKMSYSFFPHGSVFICVVDPGVGTKRKILCVKTRHFYFLAPDNGLLAPVLSEIKNYEVRSVENKKYFSTGNPSPTFHGRDVFSPVGAHLARDPGIFRRLGPKTTRIQRLEGLEIQKTSKSREGKILFFDRFGNALTSLYRGSAAPAFWKQAQIQVRDIRLGKLARTYGSAASPLVALFGSSDLIEIAVAWGSAKEVGYLQEGDTVKAWIP